VKHNTITHGSRRESEGDEDEDGLPDLNEAPQVMRRRTEL
jgi:hypothetical protein